MKNVYFKGANVFNDNKYLDNQNLNQNSRSSSLRYRFPRIFLSQADDVVTPVNGLLLMLPNRTFVPLLGMSSVGLIIPTTGILGQIKIGQILDCKLRFSSGVEPLVMKLKVMRLTARSAFMVFDGSLLESRIKIDQLLKDQIIFSNVIQRSTKNFSKSFQDSVWWNAPFDTNFLSWSGEDNQLKKAIIEYDGLIFIFENQNGNPIWYLKKSATNVDEVRGYTAPWIENENQKICMGVNWRERLIRLLDKSIYKSELSTFSQLLRAKTDV